MPAGHQPVTFRIAHLRFKAPFHPPETLHFVGPAPDAFGDLHGGDPCDQVLQLVKEWKGSHPRACIHVVAIGDYFNKKMSDFLLGIAGNTGGAFIGR